MVKPDKVRPGKEFELAEQDKYKNATIIEKPIADTMDDLGYGHYLHPESNWTRAQYAYRAATRHVGPEYFMLVPIYKRGDVEWNAIMITVTGGVDEAMRRLALEIAIERMTK